jgi:hypothetical protein
VTPPMLPPVERVFPPFLELPEPLLAFGTRRGQRGLHVHPLIGLAEHGPYTHGPTRGSRPLRLGLVAPPDLLDTAERLATELRRGHRRGERHDYLIDYPGLAAAFGIDIAADPDSVVVLPADLDDHAGRADDPRVVLFDALDTAIATAADHGGFDVLVVRAPAHWNQWFPDGRESELHDHIKVTAAAHGVATQVIRDRALTYPDRCSVAWRLAIATYAKAGGIPWKLATTTPNTMFIGIGYALRPTPDKRYVIGAAHVSDEHGTGLTFATLTATEDDGTVTTGSNPHLTRPQMHALISRALDSYQHHHDGRLPRRVAVHKSTPWHTPETEGALDALARVHDIDLLQVQSATPWRAVRGVAGPSGAPEPDAWPVHRGTVLHLSDDEILLWTQGNTPGAAAVGHNYSQHGTTPPAPILIRRHAGHIPAEQVATEILALTKMDWNNDSLHNRLPATLTGAAVIARTKSTTSAAVTGAWPFRWLQ